MANAWAATHSAPIIPLYAHPLHVDAILPLATGGDAVAGDAQAATPSEGDPEQPYVEIMPIRLTPTDTHASILPLKRGERR